MPLHSPSPHPSHALPARPGPAAEIYYNCSLVAQNEQLYNNLYSAYWGAQSTITDIVSREASRVVRDYLLGLKKDPFMVSHAALWDGCITSWHH